VQRIREKTKHDSELTISAKSLQAAFLSSQRWVAVAWAGLRVVTGGLPINDIGDVPWVGVLRNKTYHTFLIGVNRRIVKECLGIKFEFRRLGLLTQTLVNLR